MVFACIAMQKKILMGGTRNAFLLPPRNRAGEIQQTATLRLMRAPAVNSIQNSFAIEAKIG
jgi:hypothetical protein